jgi:hypothetical protein
LEENCGIEIWQQVLNFQKILTSLRETGKRHNLFSRTQASSPA